MLFTPSPVVNIDREIQDKDTWFSFCSVSPVHLNASLRRGSRWASPHKAADPTSETSRPGFGLEEWKMGFARGLMRGPWKPRGVHSTACSVSPPSLWHIATELTAVLVNSQQCNTAMISHVAICREISKRLNCKILLEVCYVRDLISFCFFFFFFWVGGRRFSMCLGKIWQ